MFPGYHIDSITNGVHAAFWTAPAFRELYDRYIPSWKSDPLSLRLALSLKQRRIWDAHAEAKTDLLHEVNKRYKTGFNEKVFTIGFARRAATYKRADLLFSDLERLKRIAANSHGGIQILFAGKAHPSDAAGQEVIARIVDAIKHLEGDIKACYLEDYDIALASKLVAGVDIWLNTPERPYEASGTSGMKAALNGVPHFSVLDGWWLEGHVENVTGWSIGGESPEQSPAAYQREIDDLYGKLEYTILPLYYHDREGWIDVMRNTIALNGAFFNTHRMVHQYVLNAYFKDHTP
jgi:starch phosphorylase